MTDRHIISVPAATKGKPGVVIEVRQNGSDPLDVRLVGSEGEYPYVTTIKQRSIGKLQNKASDEEWRVILSHFLLQKQPEGKKTEFLKNVRIDYALKGDDIHVTVWKDVEGIKMTLGQIELRRDEVEEINPVDWADASAQAHSEALQEKAQLKAELDGAQSRLDKLNAQLEDFIKTKEETETAMLQQFMALLNEKKRKIRDQNRLLAGAKVDKTTATAVQSAREDTRPRRPGPSRSFKRKAPAPADEAKDESDDAQMEIDQSKAEEQNDESGPEAATPDRSTDDETEDEDEDGPTPPDPAPALRSQSKAKSPEQDKANAGVTRSSRKEPPPRRELPFLRNKPAAKKQPSPPPADEGDDTEDEEL